MGTLHYKPTYIDVTTLTTTLHLHLQKVGDCIPGNEKKTKNCSMSKSTVALGDPRKFYQTLQLAHHFQGLAVRERLQSIVRFLSEQYTFIKQSCVFHHLRQSCIEKISINVINILVILISVQILIKNF